MKTIARMYDDYGDAAAIVGELERAGIPREDISLVANQEAHGRHTATAGTRDVTTGEHLLDPAAPDDTHGESGAKRGSTLGGVAGGVVGLLTGLGVMAIPGVGPLVAAGWLVTTLAGAAAGAGAGGLVGALTGAGVSHDEAHVYNEGVKRGGSLVTVRVDDAQVGRVEAIMHQIAPVDWQERRTSYAGSDPATAYPPDTRTASTTTSATGGSIGPAPTGERHSGRL